MGLVYLNPYGWVAGKHNFVISPKLAAIIALIGVTGTVISGIATFFIFLVRREKKVDDVTNMYDSANGNGRFN